MNLYPECLKWYNLWYPLKNIWMWRKAIWKSRPWDYQGVYLLLRDQLAYMEHTNRLYSYHTNKSKTSHDMKICINLLDRLIADDYGLDKAHYEMVHREDCFVEIKMTYKHFLPRGSLHKLTNGIQKNDTDLLFKILHKKLNHWWS